MTALGEAQARIASIRKLRAVVSAMRGIAAAHVETARQSLQGFRTYAEVIAGGLGRAVQLLPPGHAQDAPVNATVTVVFTAEHGFAGAFSASVFETVGPVTPRELMVVGHRGVLLAEEKGWKVGWSTGMASQAAGVAATARRVADHLYEQIAQRRFSGVEVVYAKDNARTVARTSILPIDFSKLPAAKAGAAPLTNLPPARLAEQLVGEYLFAQLALAALESFASENAARLATMQSARLNTDQKLDELVALERQLRQEQITAEVQEVVSGALGSVAPPAGT
jgi:F-type H+-transporting ATPase subunit gamma